MGGRALSWLRAGGVAAAHPISSLRVVAWTRASVRALDQSLHRDGLAATSGLSTPPTASARHRRIVAGLLRRRSCLVRSAVLQRWDADHGHGRPLVIGVARDGDGYAAHAWLEGERSGDGFVDLHRRPPA